ncbi:MULTISPECIES: hypothetical protein [unclassified Nocardioides]|uniref:hypothetical protein n=1 Tax=unclassified Nocardioides TaxID=2615069 RepID=UPI0000571A43|nr:MULTISPECIES: hypothetical protein [unclassified Nocardioides]ABL80903.1 hypothetical protein Noca_1389 [Nocardioides sp. JS614]
MNLRTITARAAGAGAVTALIAGGLVAATSTTADAAEVTGSYACTALGSPVGSFPLSVSVPLLPPSAPAGMTITPLLGVEAHLVVPSVLLQAAGIDGGTVDDFGMTLGSETIGAPLTVTDIADNGDGTSTVNATGINETFTTPRAGTYDVKLPTAFTFSSTSQGNPSVPVACSTADPATLGTVALSKQASEMTVKAVKRHRVIVTVTNEYSTPSGKVVAKVGKKAFSEKLDSNGKTVFTFPKALKGKKAVFSYKGDGFTAGDSKDALGKPISVIIK